MKLYLYFTLALFTSFAFGQTRTMKLDADCVAIRDGVCIDKNELGYLDGASSNLQTQITTTGTTAASDLAAHAADTTSIHGITDTSALATKTGAETLTNKTLTSPAISSPTGLVKGDVGLGNVDNTSDANKPVSTATQTALDAKVAGAASSIDSEVMLFSGTGGKTAKRATGSGFAKLTSGVLSTSSTVNAATELTGIAPVANGGTGASTLTANNVILGNGTSAVQVVAPSTAGNYLTSDGTTWASVSPDVSILYFNVASTSLGNGPTTIPFATSTGGYDTNSAFSSNTTFTVPSGKGGKYRIKAMLNMSGVVNSGQTLTLTAFINGTTTYLLDQMTYDNANARVFTVQGDIILALAAGDTVVIRLTTTTAGNMTLSNTSGYNYINIRKI